MAPPARPCRCGSRGCIEAYVGAPNLIARLQERQPNSPLLRHANQKAIIQAIGDGAVASDDDARALLSESVQYLGASIGSLINLINPELVVLGGWAGALLGDVILPELREVVERYALYAGTRLELSQLGWDAVSLGAASLAVQAFLVGNEA